MRRLPAFLLAPVALAPAALAQDYPEPMATTAEQVVENHRRALMGRSSADASRSCDPASGPDEVVVCGRNDAEHRIGPIAPEAGQVVAGETPSGYDALAAGRCLTRCPHGGLDVIAIINAVRRGVERLLDPDS